MLCVFIVGMKKRCTCSGNREAKVLPACRAISVCCSTVGPCDVIKKHIHKNTAPSIVLLKCYNGLVLYQQVSLLKRRFPLSSLQQCL